MLHKRNGLRLSDHFFEGEPGIDNYERTQQSFSYQFEHRFNDVFTARQNFRYQDSDVSMDQVYSAGWTDADSNILNRAYTGGDERLHSYIIDNMLQAEFFTGAAKHTLLLGADYQRRKADVAWRYGTVDPLDAANPQYGNGNLEVLGENRYQRRLQQTGAYLQDLVELDQWRFSLGLRQDWVKVSEENRDSDTKVNDQRTKFTTRAGVLYLFENGIAPYVSYSESFNPNTVSDQEGRPLAPTEGTQWEAGIKYQLRAATTCSPHRCSASSRKTWLRSSLTRISIAR